MTFTDCVARWIDRRELNRASSTISGYRRLLRLYVAPTEAGGLELEDLDESDLIEVLRPLIARGCTRQAQLLQILVAAALKEAVRRREITNSPMDFVEHIKHQPQATPWLSIEHARRLLETSAANGDPFYIAWVLMLGCGLRRGEMLALRWDDIDLERQTLRVERQKISIEGRIQITRPKSRASVREIPLEGQIVALLRLNRRGQGPILQGVSEKQLHDALERALNAAQVPRVTLHGLRHTMAAVAAGEGIPIKILQGLMGHAHYQTTADIYAHVDQQPRRKAAEQISGALLGTRLEIA